MKFLLINAFNYLFWQEKRRSYRNMYYWFSWRANEEKVRRNGALEGVDAISRKLKSSSLHSGQKWKLKKSA